MARTRVFVDTNIILEAFRTNCWTAICQAYAIETVEKCIEETLTGNPNNSAHISVDRDKLVGELSNNPHKITKQNRVEILLHYPHCQGLDDGELHLFASLRSQKLFPNPLISISTADKAAIVAAEKLGWIENVVSLEQLIRNSGVSRNQRNSLRENYKTTWLNEVKTKIQLGVIP